MVEKRKLVAVQPRTNSKFLYGYRSDNYDKASTLGVVDLETSSPIKDVAFSPKNIKPYRAYKPGIIAKGGFVDISKVPSLENAGYNVSRKNPGTPKGGPKSVIVGVRVTPDLVLTWRYPKSKWAALPAKVKTAAGVALASTYPTSEHAFHADGFVLKTASVELDIPAGTYVSKNILRQTISDPDTGKNYNLYKGTSATAPF